MINVNIILNNYSALLFMCFIKSIDASMKKTSFKDETFSVLFTD